MTSAAVGFQCPECIAAGRATTRQATTALGGRIRTRPIVTMSLIGINSAIYVISLFLSASGDSLIVEFGMWPVAIALEGEWWRLLTAAFLHAGLLHIGFNMFVLYLLGPPLEQVLGSSRFLILYLVSALGGSVASYASSPANTVSVGASGAIFGLMAAFLVVGKRFRRDVSQVAVLLAVNLVIGFVLPQIDWRAHIGGALTGAAIAAVMAYAPKASRVLWQSLGTLAVLMILVLVTIARTIELQGVIGSLAG